MHTMEKMPDYTELVSGMRQHFLCGKTKSMEYRLQQLGNLLKLLDNHQKELVDAIYDDIKKPNFEATTMEFLFVKSEVMNAINHLQEWMQFHPAEADILNKLNHLGYYYEPYGVVLIIGAWNYPLSLNLQPLVGAIAAGNCAIVKPSEISPTIAELFAKLFNRYLDEDCFRIVNGAIPETSALLKEKFDYIFYTGSTFVGKIVMKAAAEHLTPVTLELGGKCPCYVAPDCNFDIAANRILWAKLANSGQTCLAPDYVLCHKDDQQKLIASMKKTIINFYDNNPKESPDFARIINNRHFNRVKKLLVEKKVVIGGETDEASNYIAPTVMTNVSADDAVMQEEIFGPILPMIHVDGVKECIEFIKTREKPLAAYIFAKDKRIADEFTASTSSGSVCVNDCILQAAAPSLPFGGVGASGMGAYHHKYTFETFSHKKSCLVKKQGLESLESIRYPPYKQSRVGLFKMAMLPGRNWPWLSLLKYGLAAAVIGILYQLFDVQIALRK